MGGTGSASLIALILLFTSTPGVAAKLPGTWEVALQSFTDSIDMGQDEGPNIPLKTRALGIFAGYNNCFKFYKRNCFQVSYGLGLNSAVVESQSESYVYKDTGVMIYQALVGVGARHFFPKSRAMATVGLDAELRNATYKSPGYEYSIRKENLSYHLWLKAQFTFPVSAKVGFIQTFLVSPLDSEFAYRFGLSF